MIYKKEKERCNCIFAPQLVVFAVLVKISSLLYLIVWRKGYAVLISNYGTISIKWVIKV